MKQITMPLELGLKQGRSLTNFFAEKFWERGLLPMKNTIKIVVFHDGKMEVSARCAEVDPELMPKLDVRDLQAIIDGFDCLAQDPKENRP